MRLQLVVRRSDAPSTGVLTDALIAPDRLAHRLRLLQALNSIVHAGVLPARLMPPDPRGPHNARVLQALDGWLSNATHRQIACTIFGERRVARDWGDPRENLRDVVRRAVTRGRYLMSSGYRQFLT